VAAALVAVEGLSGVVAGAGFVVAALAGDPADRRDAVALGVLLLLLGGGVIAVARGVWRAARWAQAPALLAQFLALVVAWNQRSSSVAAVALVTGVVALAALAALVLTLRREE
jgi:hypothetical protein